MDEFSGLRISFRRFQEKQGWRSVAFRCRGIVRRPRSAAPMTRHRNAALPRLVLGSRGGVEVSHQRPAIFRILHTRPPHLYSSMPATGAHSHICRDGCGVAWVDDTNVKVIEIALDHLAYGWSADAMHEQFPHLSLAQIHAALAFFY